MPSLAVIGGTGLTHLEGLEIVRREVINTPYGEPSGALTYGHFAGQEVVFLARHGHGHTLPPHRVNYRANLWALKQVGVTQVLAVAAVGGIHLAMGPGRIVIPDQIIDYTYGRPQTFFEPEHGPVRHIDFTEPYCESLRHSLHRAGQAAGISPYLGGVYGATQGPRLETAAEIRRMTRDGCDLVGMTGMPEAALARELELCYAHCAVVANWAAGCGGTHSISLAEIEQTLTTGMLQLRRLLHVWLSEGLPRQGATSS